MNVLMSVVIIVAATVCVDPAHSQQTSTETTKDFRVGNSTTSKYIQKIPKKILKSLPATASTVSYGAKDETTERTGIKYDNVTSVIRTANIIKTRLIKLKCPNGKIVNANGRCVDVFPED